ncbi:MAG TPA: hypothetical protein DIW81_24220 [Planctomycetaceae bacterium]|nr:hypothetical protein [Rubinisphaera sp.]HCS54653.1 hypothetical protein [Planctomycetaceae bacterium]
MYFINFRCRLRIAKAAKVFFSSKLFTHKVLVPQTHDTQGLAKRLNIGLRNRRNRKHDCSLQITVALFRWFELYYFQSITRYTFMDTAVDSLTLREISADCHHIN